MERDLAPGEWAVLGLLSERPAHGWALTAELGPTGELGSIWSIGRPVVYRSLDLLAARGLIEPAGREPGRRGPHRTVYRATEAGRAAFERWLREPVRRVRDVRSLLLLKLVLGARSGVDPAAMLAAQRATLVAGVEALERRLAASAGTEAVLIRFRLESTRAVLRFLDGLRERPELASAV